MGTCYFLLILICFNESVTMGNTDDCENVLNQCLKHGHWTRCYEEKIVTCRLKARRMLNFSKSLVNSSNEAEQSPTTEHTVHIPANALQKSRKNASLSLENVVVVVSVLNSSLFRLGPAPGLRGREVLEQSVVAVKVGDQAVNNLDQPVRIRFKHSNESDRGICVFWKDSDDSDGTGNWSTDGCETSHNHNEFVCSCNHLSFFAVLLNPKVSVNSANAVGLNYISYIGSSLSVMFTLVTLSMYLCQRKGRSEQSIGIHMQLTGALLSLHLSFLLSGWWAWHGAEGHVCLALGLLLHWALLSTFTWMAIEGFHLYVLLVRVFNIYIRKYLLKLSLVGWGIPTGIVVACGFSGVYGKYSLYVKGGTNGSDTELCWLSSAAGSVEAVSYVTVSGYLGLVFLFNTAMLGVVVVKLWRLKGKGTLYQEVKSRRWKDWATVLGLSCVLGLPWGLIFCTYGPIPLPGLYLFSVFNCFQGVFMFLWFLALTRNSRPEERSSVKDPSTQKMETSFNN